MKHSFHTFYLQNDNQSVIPSLIHDEGHIDVSCHRQKALKEKAKPGLIGKSGASSVILLLFLQSEGYFISFKFELFKNNEVLVMFDSF